MNYVEQVVNKFGGPAALAFTLGFPYKDTVTHWIKRGVIPTQRQHQMKKLSDEKGWGVKIEDFWPPELRD